MIQTVSLGCGETTSDNCTYLQSSSTGVANPNPCVYTICKCSSDVTRLRFDFLVRYDESKREFVVHLKFTGFSNQRTCGWDSHWRCGGCSCRKWWKNTLTFFYFGTSWTILIIIFILGASIGDCTTDTFSISSPGNIGSPVICGFNTGQHSKISFLNVSLLKICDITEKPWKLGATFRANDSSKHLILRWLFLSIL